jgi:hypothetical protein
MLLWRDSSLHTLLRAGQWRRIEPIPCHPLWRNPQGCRIAWQGVHGHDPHHEYRNGLAEKTLWMEQQRMTPARYYRRRLNHRDYLSLTSGLFERLPEAFPKDLSSSTRETFGLI